MSKSGAFDFILADVVTRHRVIVIVAHGLLPAGAWIEIADLVDGGEVIVVCVTDKPDFRSDDLGTRATVTADHGRA